MHPQNLLLVSVTLLVISSSYAFVCPPDYCQNRSCERIEKCELNQMKKPGGLCNCCDVCFTILGENEPCPYLNAILMGFPPTPEECGPGLACLDGTCKKIPQPNP